MAMCQGLYEQFHIELSQRPRQVNVPPYVRKTLKHRLSDCPNVIDIFHRYSAFLPLLTHLEVKLYFLFWWNPGTNTQLSLTNEIWASNMCCFRTEGWRAHMSFAFFHSATVTINILESGCSTALVLSGGYRNRAPSPTLINRRWACCTSRIELGGLFL